MWRYLNAIMLGQPLASLHEALKTMGIGQILGADPSSATACLVLAMSLPPTLSEP